MATWEAVASLATAGGTLVLAAATFSSVRSANRAARTAERALLAGIRPVLAPARLQDLPQKIMWADQHWATLEGGHAVVEEVGDVIYLAIAVRNSGSGFAVLQGWDLQAGWRPGTADHIPPADFHRQGRDLYVAGNDIGFWQAAIRNRDDPLYSPVARAVAAGDGISVDVLYSDDEGGQRTITRFGVVPARDHGWLTTVSRHWQIDRPAPR
jgi:hypothetical protein